MHCSDKLSTRAWFWTSPLQKVQRSVVFCFLCLEEDRVLFSISPTLIQLCLCEMLRLQVISLQAVQDDYAIICLNIPNGPYVLRNCLPKLLLIQKFLHDLVICSNLPHQFSTFFREFLSHLVKDHRSLSRQRSEYPL